MKSIIAEEMPVAPAPSVPVFRRALNSFQRSMLQWNSMHPYNAVHVVRVTRSLQHARLRDAINKTLSRHALAQVNFDSERGSFYFFGGPGAYAFELLPPDSCAMPSLAGEIERQLNTQFLQPGPFQPFRFFVAPGETYFWLGLSYLHAVADAVAVVLLLREIVEVYGGVRPPNDSSDLRTKFTRGGSQLSQGTIMLRKLAAIPGFLSDLRCSFRPHYRDPRDLGNRFLLGKLNPAQMQSLVRSSKALAVTVNDILLAILLKALSRLAQGRLKQERRRKISVGCIVNTRKDSDFGNTGVVGLFLGSFVLTHEVPEQMDLTELVRDVARRTHEIKSHKLYLTTSMELAFGRFMLSFYSTERRKKLYQKHYPLWGGLTNMNINTLWQAEPNAEPIDYIRAVSTGPVTPLVLSFTTAGDVAHMSVSYRETAFSASDIEDFVSAIFDSLNGLEEKA